MVGALSPLLKFVLVVYFGVAVFLSHHHIDNVLCLEGLFGGQHGFEGVLHLFACRDTGFGMDAVVAAATVLHVVVFTEVTQEVQSAAYR